MANVTEETATIPNAATVSDLKIPIKWIVQIFLGHSV